MNQATWKKGKKRITGWWKYIWHSDVFIIQLDGKDPETGMQREPFEVKGENPEFGGWRLLEQGKLCNIGELQ